MKSANDTFCRQWLAKAGSDWKTVEILLTSPAPPPESICFHCQQYVEKLLKAFLTRHEIEFPKTHDLRRLVNLALPQAPELGAMTAEADALSFYGVQSRYPDEYHEIEREEMIFAVEAARKFERVLGPLLDIAAPRDEE